MKLFCKHWTKQQARGWSRPICKDCPLKARIKANRAALQAKAKGSSHAPA